MFLQRNKMSFTRNLFCLLLLAVLVLSQTEDDGVNKTDDEKRPYKFGFNIEGYQHRYEEKDSKGIIMGEYGFITGDGVYHLTVYATDENGKFRILKMKNTYIGLPMEKTTTPAPPPVEKVTNGKFSGLAACGGCIVPSTTPSTSNSVSGGGNFGGGTETPASPTVGGGAQFKSGGGPSTQLDHGNPSIQTLGPNVQENPSDFDSSYPNVPPVDTAGPVKVETGTSLGPASPSNSEPAIPQNQSDRNGKTLPLPSDLLSPLMGLLYKFNYTLVFNGHAETGDRAGSKNGSYFFDGQDGFIRNVTYTANEFGYQPNISLVEVDSKDTKRGKENELLWNEFKWFY